MSTKQATGTWLKTDDTTEEVKSAKTKWALAELQLHVGGYIEIVHRTNLPNGSILIVNEDGRQMGLVVNDKASLIAGQVIRGNALIIKMKDMD